eukprot:GILJ01006466.1.p1 GENE.GILJ01006466.1~~GILJ01006466.1.p1  ORF type:complete len:391 (-),score=45.87 GILJ01006466.1:72-1244(-)
MTHPRIYIRNPSNPIMASTIELTFLGTGSAAPSTTRNHTSIALRMDASVWLFDAGEGTQHQLMKSNVKMGKIERIFLTHLHGDHAFGLPGLMCTLTNSIGNGAGDAVENRVMHIYGPCGTRSYIRNALRSSFSHLGFQFKVHELHLPTDAGTDDSSPHDDELLGENLMLKEGHWRVHVDDKFTVVACPLVHTVATVGYVIEEAATPGKLLVERIQPSLQRNKEALAAQGTKNPMALLSRIKGGEVITLPDGEVLDPSLLTGPTRTGRKVVILGDTSCSDAIVPFAMQADVVVHEATNACLADDTKTEEEVDTSTRDHGHSTPQMAGRFANQVAAHMLILTHFSQRYKGDASEESLAVMKEIAALAVRTYGCENVLTAADLMSVEISRQPS